MRTTFFVDGYNLFYGLLSSTPYKWLNLPSLLAHIARVENPNSELVTVNYFTSHVKPSLATRGDLSKQAQDTYIRALKARDVKVITGRHQLEKGRAPAYVDDRTPASRQNQVDIWKLEEKETDVNIAIHMYRLAAKQPSLAPEDQIQQIVLVSADTDMTPALRALCEDFPNLRIGVILPHREGIKRNPPGSLKDYSHWMRKQITEAELQSHQFPAKVPTRKKPAIKPDYW